MSRVSGKKKRTSSGRTDVRLVLAAGAVLYRMEDSEPVVAVIHRPRYDDWSLPKGKADPGESLPVAAVREIEEETGFTAELEDRIGTNAYPLTETARKEVTYWSALATGGRFEPNPEVDELRWLPLDQAEETVSYPLDRKILRRFRTAPRADRVLLLVRHAKAGRRSEWHGDDDARPLDKSGRTQAELLAPMLRAFGADRLHSAPRVRCEQTLAPLADELGARILIEPEMADEAYLDDPDASVTRLLRIAAGPGVAAVSSQGTAVPGLVGDLAARAGLEVGEAFTKKAGVWALGFAGTSLIYADYYASPLPVR